MRKIVPIHLEICRVDHPFGGRGRGLTGAFMVPCSSTTLKIIASDADIYGSEGWEHVSVSCKNRCPNWEEMSYVKDLFWAEDETVVQYHPKKSEYVNCHPYVLHMWRNVQFEFRLPPSIFVGPDSAKGK